MPPTHAFLPIVTQIPPGLPTRRSHAAARPEHPKEMKYDRTFKVLKTNLLRGSPVDAKTPEYRVGRPQAVNASDERDRARPPVACRAWQTQRLNLGHAIREALRV